ncbi:MAG TPA: hypothetical protein O0W79_03900 [Methanocorpusculum sp.]|nr:hypothetical protein [Methanocorpusculum sp.]
MIHFPPSTECMVFDLEAYVPKEDRRKRNGISLAVNPYRPGHTLLGGVFHIYCPLTGDVVTNPSFTHQWLWDKRSEKNLIEDIYSLFLGMRTRAAGKKSYYAEPCLAGVGIVHFDLPYLIAKCIEYNVAPAADVYDTMTKFRVIELTSAGIGYLPKLTPWLYPVSHNAMADALLSEREEKPTGKVVWDMYDEKNYADIAKRCESEVKEIKGVAEKLQELSISQQP